MTTAIDTNVIAALIAAPGRTEAFVSSLLEENGIVVDWNLNEPIWRLAGRAFQAYAERRRQQRDHGPCRIPHVENRSHLIENQHGRSDHRSPQPPLVADC